MFRGLPLSPRCCRRISARSDALAPAVPTSLTSSLHQPPSHVSLQPAVRRRQGRRSGGARPQLPPYPPLSLSETPPPHLRDHHPSVPRSPLSTSRGSPRKPELVRFWFGREARGRAGRVEKKNPFTPSGFRCYSPEFRVEPPRGRCQKSCETETTTSLKMQPETRGSRADAIFE